MRYSHRYYADAAKAADKKLAAVRQFVAYQVLGRIRLIYKLEETLKDLTHKEHLQDRQASIKSLVEEYFV